MWILSGGADPLFSPILAMNTEFTSDPTFIEVVVSAPVGTAISYNGTLVSTITPGIDAPEVLTMGATLTTTIGRCTIPFGRQLPQSEQLRWTVAGLPGTEIMIDYVGWQYD